MKVKWSVITWIGIFFSTTSITVDLSRCYDSWWKIKRGDPLCHLYAMVIEKGKRGDPLKASERCLLEFNENVHQKYAQVYI